MAKTGLPPITFMVPSAKTEIKPNSTVPTIMINKAAKNKSVVHSTLSKASWISTPLNNNRSTAPIKADSARDIFTYSCIINKNMTIQNMKIDLLKSLVSFIAYFSLSVSISSNFEASPNFFL